MAQHGATPGEMKDHVQTYGGVMALLKWGTVASVLVVAFVIWLIA